MSYYWTPAKVFAARFVLLTAPGYPEAVKRLENYGIKTNVNVLQFMAATRKIKRPLISANWGGKRR